MPNCEMCGAIVDKLTDVKVEHVPMKVCSNCLKFGSVEKKSRTPLVKKRFVRDKQVNTDYEFIVPNAGTLIKEAREKKNMRQVDLARRMVVKESVVHQIESNHRKPTLAEAQKFESSLGITLVAKSTGNTDVELETTKTAGFTIGDLIKDKRTQK